jgi:DnaJ-class molecular chaperone
MFNEPMGGPVDDFGPSLSEAITNFSRQLAIRRARQVEERIEKLLAAGVMVDRLHLQDNKDCPRCAGMGVILSLDTMQLRGELCDQCLGVAMIVDRRSVTHGG